jgi:hypothetical protein
VVTSARTRKSLPCLGNEIPTVDALYILVDFELQHARSTSTGQLRVGFENTNVGFRPTGGVRYNWPAKPADLGENPDRQTYFESSELVGLAAPQCTWARHTDSELGAGSCVYRTAASMQVGAERTEMQWTGFAS